MKLNHKFTTTAAFLLSAMLFAGCAGNAAPEESMPPESASPAPFSDTEISSGKKSFKQRLSLWIRGNLFVPDPRVGWVKPSVRFLKKYLAEHPVDVIVTTGPPHSMHLIGQRLHKELGIPWIPDFRDPWSRMYYLKHLEMYQTGFDEDGALQLVRINNDGSLQNLRETFAKPEA